MMQSLERNRIAVIGATGYTGIELLRLLSLHPRVCIAAVTSEQSAGKSVAQVLPSLGTGPFPPLEALDIESVAQKADFFFIALPAGSAMEAAAALVQKGKKVIDLSADYRLRDPRVYETWYRRPHRHPALLGEAVYGLCEIHRQEIAKARLVANPGCYPVSVLLALQPLVKEGLVNWDRPLIVDAKSGVSGAGRSPALNHHFPELNEGLAAYGLAGHRHLPEMTQELSALAGDPVKLAFTPHLLPINRGILSTVYLSLRAELSSSQLLEIYKKFYQKEPFVRILEEGQSPNPHHVRGSNYCHIGVAVDSRTGLAVLLSAIDNLVKGASGQAVQCMNLMMGFEETVGLESPGIFP